MTSPQYWVRISMEVWIRGLKAALPRAPLAPGPRRFRRSDAHRDDVLERGVDAHVELDDVLARQHDEVAPGRIGRRRHVDADIVAAQVIRHIPARHAGQECDRPGAGRSSDIQQVKPKEIKNLHLNRR